MIRSAARSAAGWKTLVDVLRTRAEVQAETLSHAFLLDGEKNEVSCTYGDLDRRARAIAVAIREVAGPGDRALILAPPGLDFVASFFGCLYSGAVAVPTATGGRSRHGDRLGGIVRSARPTVLLAPAALLADRERQVAQVPALAGLEWIAVDQVDLGGAGAWRDPELPPESLAFLQYTSGSTGDPKGVEVAHDNLLANLARIERAFSIRPGDSSVLWLPPYHDMGLVGAILEPVYSDVRVTLFPPIAFLQKPLRWLEGISRRRARISGGPNFAFELAIQTTTEADRARLDLSCWEVAFTGAEPVRPGTLERFAAAFAASGFRREAFLPCYGLAEATLYASSGPCRTFRARCGELGSGVAVRAAADEPAHEIASCGFAPCEDEVAIVEPETRRPVPEGRIGEIWLRGPSIARGYWERPDETRAVFHASLAEGGRGPFLRTGDLGFLAGGELHVTGRIKDLILVAGRNHFPEDIERTVEACHPAFRPSAIAAFSVEHERQERLVLLAEVERTFLSQARSPEADARRELLRTVREVVAHRHELAVHDLVVLRPGGLPRTTSGKIQRHACRTGYLDGSLVRPGA